MLALFSGSGRVVAGAKSVNSDHHKASLRGVTTRLEALRGMTRDNEHNVSRRVAVQCTSPSLFLSLSLSVSVK